MIYTIEIRDCALLFTSSKKKSGLIDVYDCFEIPLTGNKGIDGRVLKEALTERKINQAKVHLIINDRTALTRVLVVPSVDRKRMALIVKNELISSLNLKQDCVVDYLNIESFVNTEGNFERVLAVGLKRSVIEQWESFLNSINIKITSVQTFTSSIIRVFNYLDLIPKTCPSLIVDICKNYTRFFLYIDGKYSVLRTVNTNEDNNQEANRRNINLIRLFTNSLAKQQYSELKSIKIFGEDEYVMALYESVKGNLNHEIQLVNHEGFSFPELKNSGNYLNTMGALL